jgi:hypothetical protein
VSTNNTPVPDTDPWLAGGDPVIVDDSPSNPDDLDLDNLPTVINDHPQG